MLLAMLGREWAHALLRMPGSTIISCPRGGVNGRRLISLVLPDRLWLLTNVNAWTTVEERRFRAA